LARISWQADAAETPPGEMPDLPGFLRRAAP
jgi:hypothetical protein